DAERRDLREAGRLDAGHLGVEGCAAPAFDRRRGSDLDLHGIRRQQLDDDLEIVRIADLDQWRAGYDDLLAALHDLQHLPADGRSHLDAAVLGMLPHRRVLRPDATRPGLVELTLAHLEI